VLLRIRGREAEAVVGERYGYCAWNTATLSLRLVSYKVYVPS
jgi:hypothetical protein